MTIEMLTTRFGGQVETPLLCPFRSGSRVIIPAGTPIRYRGENRATKAKRTITVHYGTPGYLTDFRGDFGAVRPSITWAGSGGYWVDCRLTEAIFEANEVTPEPNEQQVSAWKHDAWPEPSTP